MPVTALLLSLQHPGNRLIAWSLGSRMTPNQQTSRLSPLMPERPMVSLGRCRAPQHPSSPSRRVSLSTVSKAVRTPRVHSPPARPDGFDLRLQDEELYEDEPAVEAQALPKFADLIASSAVIDAVRDPFSASQFLCSALAAPQSKLWILNSPQSSSACWSSPFEGLRSSVGSLKDTDLKRRRS